MLDIYILFEKVTLQNFPLCFFAPLDHFGIWQFERLLAFIAVQEVDPRELPKAVDALISGVFGK